MPLDNTTPAYDVTDLISWLETQKPRQRYHYADDKRCLISRWLTARTSRAMSLQAALGWVYGDGTQRFDMTAIEMCVAAERPHTFGAALVRARQLAHG